MAERGLVWTTQGSMVNLHSEHVFYTFRARTQHARDYTVRANRA